MIGQADIARARQLMTDAFPKLLEDQPEVAMVDELEADINAQRQWFEENKDKPLF